MRRVAIALLLLFALVRPAQRARRQPGRVLRRRRRPVRGERHRARAAGHPGRRRARDPVGDRRRGARDRGADAPDRPGLRAASGARRRRPQRRRPAVLHGEPVADGDGLAAGADRGRRRARPRRARRADPGGRAAHAADGPRARRAAARAHVPARARGGRDPRRGGARGRARRGRAAGAARAAGGDDHDRGRVGRGRRPAVVRQRVVAVGRRGVRGPDREAVAAAAERRWLHARVRSRPVSAAARPRPRDAPVRRARTGPRPGRSPPPDPRRPSLHAAAPAAAGWPLRAVRGRRLPVRLPGHRDRGARSAGPVAVPAADRRRRAVARRARSGRAVRGPSRRLSRRNRRAVAISCGRWKWRARARTFGRTWAWPATPWSFATTSPCSLTCTRTARSRCRR